MNAPAVNVRLNVQFLSEFESLPEKKLLTRWAIQALGDKTAELTLRIVNEQEGRELNKTWRKKDYASNVLAFPVGGKIYRAEALLGDIVICAPVVEREAREQGKDNLAHWAHLLVHGILHLLGYDHVTEEDAGVMEAEEIRILNKMGYANPYVANDDR